MGSGLVLIGFCAGAFAMDALHIWSRPMLARAVCARFELEQELLASREAREGQLVASLVHRANVAAAWSEEDCPPLKSALGEFRTTRFLPLVLWAIQLRVRREYPDPNPEGARRVAAMQWHRVALTLEALGLEKEAATLDNRIAPDLPKGLSPSFAALVDAERDPSIVESENLLLGREPESAQHPTDQRVQRRAASGAAASGRSPGRDAETPQAGAKAAAAANP